MRLQLALNVSNIDDAVAYYTKLFGVQPHKRRPGYANFAIDAPPLKLVLFEQPAAEQRLNHLGVEVFDDGEVDGAERRLEAAGLLDEVQREETCCHATQNKVWSAPLDGVRWEWYRITDDAPADTGAAAEAAACCSPEGAANQKACC